ncbi:hypothetical protein ACS0TY_026287 [Phlomoides rotata]
MVGSGTVCVVGELATYNLQSYSFKSCNSYVEYPCSVKPLVLQGSKIRLTRSSRRRTRTRSLVIRGNLGGQYEDNFEDVQRQMLDFFTYKAVRTVMNQLNEKNPTQYRWFQDYVASNELGYGKSFIRNLGKKCDHVEMYKRISDQNLELLRERLLETVVWPPFDDSNTE